MSVCTRTLRPLQHLPRALTQPQSRTFFGTSSPTTQTLSATRTLHHPSMDIFSIIADIESYPSFIPLCRDAKITSWSRPDTHYQTKWPQRATLTVGYGDAINERFTSRVFCVPPHTSREGRAGVGFVEALGGQGDIVAKEVKDRLAAGAADVEHLEHHDVETNDVEGENVEGGPLSMLRTRWTVRGYPYKPSPGDGTVPQKGSTESSGQERTDVSLTIEFAFSNVAYDIMSRAVTPGLAEKTIDAFEKRVDALLKN